MNRKPLMIALNSTALAAAAISATGGTMRDTIVFENRGGQAMPKGAQRAVQASAGRGRKQARAAAAELTAVGQKHIVLGHIHPRWLRAEVERRMDLGEEITAERIAELRRGS